MNFNIRKEIGVKLDSEHWCDDVPKSVETSHEGNTDTILCNQQVRTDTAITISKPGIVIRDDKKGTCMLIDGAIPGNRNVIKREAEKILKYKDLIIEI